MMIELKNIYKNKIIKILHNLKSAKGFSLVEMLIVVLIISVIAGIISTVYITSVKSQKDILNKASSETNIRTSLYSITKDIREATGVLSATNNYLKFNADINNDSVSEDVEYILTGSSSVYTLNKKVNGGSNIFIMDHITDSSIFSYFTDSSGSALQVPLSSQNLSAFKLVKINFTVNREPSNPVKSVSLSTVVSLRNR